MQTFLPYPSFIESARALDDKRLGKQRVECLQILKALTDPAYGWQRHPAVEMWRGYSQALVRYGLQICREWRRRGFRDTCLEKTQAFSNDALPIFPLWLGDEDFHASHRAALLHKDPEWYGQFGWAEGPAVPGEDGRLPYIWPTRS